MFEQTFKNIDDILHKDAGCTSELDYTEQSSWLLFLKYLDALEADRALEAALEGRTYSFIIDKPYRWESWAAPKGADGKLDHNTAMTGDDLLDFVNNELFAYLHGFKQRASGAQTVEYKIGEVFGEIKNRIQSGYNLRDVIELVDELRFRSQSEKHELSHLYEAKIKNMGNAGRNGGEYYTPRPLIRAMIQVIAPKIGERIYDGACGSAGFLCEAFDYLQAKPGLTTADQKTLQTRTFYGKEKKSLAYVIAIMNMILHGIEAPNVVHANTLAANIADIQDQDRFDVILANPPFGGKERKEVQQNFPIKTGETAFLFLQHFIKSLKAGGRAAIVIKNTFLTNTDNASVSLRKLLLESCNLHTVLDCPGGTFQGAGVKTVVLFFEKGAPTRKVWFYRVNPDRNLGKTNPLNDDDLAEFILFQRSNVESAKSWTVEMSNIDVATYALSSQNPNGEAEGARSTPLFNVQNIDELGAESAKILKKIHDFALTFDQGEDEWTDSTLGEVLSVLRNGLNCKQDKSGIGTKVSRIESIWNAQFDLSRVGYAEIQEEQRKKFLLRKGDILFSHINSAVHVGKTAVFDVDDEVVHGVNLLLMRPKPIVLPSYLDIYLKFIFSTGYWRNVCKQSVNQASVNQQDINEVPIRFPGLKLQETIVNQMVGISMETQRLENNFQRQLAALDELKKALLHHAVNSDLRESAL